MSKVKFEAAKELIQSQHYDEARAILRTMDHPMAAEWLDKLDNIAPQHRRRSRGWLLVLLIAILVLGGGVVSYTQRGRFASILAPSASATLAVAAALPSTAPLTTPTEIATDVPTAIAIANVATADAATADAAVAVAEEPSETPTSEPCLYPDSSIRLVKQFLDTAVIASTTNRSALTMVLPNLLNQHSTFQQQPVPDCLKGVNASIDNGMQFAVWGFQAFGENQDPLAQSYLAQASQSFAQAYNQCAALGPLASPDPRIQNTKALWGY